MRGAIYAPRRAKQLHDMRGLAFGNITPTDLDGLIDFHDRAFAFLEFKLNGEELKAGQRKALTRLVDRIAASGAAAALFVADHRVVDSDQQVDCARTTVRWVYRDRQIHEYRESVSLRAALDAFYAEIALDTVLPPTSVQYCSVHTLEALKHGRCFICDHA